VEGIHHRDRIRDHVGCGGLAAGAAVHVNHVALATITDGLGHRDASITGKVYSAIVAGRASNRRADDRAQSTKLDLTPLTGAASSLELAEFS
jgi:hypothetical protein